MKFLPRDVSINVASIRDLDQIASLLRIDPCVAKADFSRPGPRLLAVKGGEVVGYSSPSYEIVAQGHEEIKDLLKAARDGTLIDPYIGYGCEK